MAKTKAEKTTENKKTTRAKANTKASAKAKDSNVKEKAPAKAAAKKKPAQKKPRLSKEERLRLEQEAKERKELKKEIGDEIALILSFAICVLLVLSNFSFCGAVGEIVNGALFGMFGFLAYAVPVLLVLLAWFIVANRGKNYRYIVKIILSIIIYLLVSGIVQLALGDTHAHDELMDYYRYSKEFKTGGGITGGLLCRLLVPEFGIIGTFIVLFTLEVIFILITSGKAVLKILRESISEHRRIRDERREEMDQLYDEYINSDEAAEILDEKTAVVKSFYEMNLEKRAHAEENASISAEYDNEEDNVNIPVPDGLMIKMPVDEEDYTERNFRKVEAKPEKKGKRNFFGGFTDTKNFEKKKPEEKIDNPEKEEPFILDDSISTNIEETFEEILPIIQEKFNEDFYINSEVVEAEEPYEPESSYQTEAFGKPDEVEENIPDTEEKIEEKASLPVKNIFDIPKRFFNTKDITEKPAPKASGEMSFSDTALRDKQLYSAQDMSKTVDQVPYALEMANKPLKYKKPIPKTTSDEELSKALEEETNEPISLLEETKEQAVERVITANVKEGNNNQLEFVPEEVKKEYKFPPIDLLNDPPKNEGSDCSDELSETANKLEQTLESFGVRVTVTNAARGPAVTRYELQPEVGVKVSRITGLADDIKLNLAAEDIRIEAPIPGKAAVGIEVPNHEKTMVSLRELVESEEFERAKGSIPFTIGKSIEGSNIIGDIAKMPHMLIAGSTGSGKSVCINTIIMSILFKLKPDDVKLIMIDPKVVELSVYNGIPHLLIPVVTDPKKAAAALNWACVEMDERYKKFAELSVRDLKGYNERVNKEALNGNIDENYPLMPQMVIIVDELADLMMTASNEVEDAICRLAQKARACGIHLIIATQRPSVNVITGLIKANVPSRIAFSVSSGTDSRTILDMNGAEKLLGKGDMLYFPVGTSKPVRIQGAFVSDNEVNRVVDYLKKVNEPAVYSEDISRTIQAGSSASGAGSSKAGATDEGDGGDGRDEFFEQSGRLIIEKEKASIGMLQRAFKVGFNRAARIMDQLAEVGVVSPEDGNKPRQILMTMQEYEDLLDSLQ